MKKHIALRLFLRRTICVEIFRLCMILFPFHFYALGSDLPLPFLKFRQIAASVGLTAGAGTVLRFLPFGLRAIGRFIAMFKNQLPGFFYHYLIVTALSYLWVRLAGPFNVQPWELCFLFGFIPAFLHSVIYSCKKSRAASGAVSV